ncbi:heterokaryon incompatibility protein-domain-containing protein [Xylaria arbuscula]|nr:heterokaryon incompatibility protein-domain-containing protein [Xylaria arbuscula]
MRLLNIQTSEVEEFYDPPKYAILSHTWDREMTLQEWQSSSKQQREAYGKATRAGEQAIKDGLDYIWIDTICIDKTSSAELSEAINSMFNWYEGAEVCYAYLSDVAFQSQARMKESPFRRSRWFTRGWTLQELIAPSELIFYSSKWLRIGTRDLLGTLVSEITGIGSDYLMCKQGLRPKNRTTTRKTNSLARTQFQNATIAERLSWVSNRVTSRPEDIAYCLLGLFQINMPLLYGERGNAWIRLQKELIAVSDDESIFAWATVPRLEALMGNGLDGTGLDIGPNTRLDHLVGTGWKYSGGSSMHAPDPVNFYGCGDNFRLPPIRKLPYSMTNAGLFMRLPLMQIGPGYGLPVYLAALHCGPDTAGNRTTHMTCYAVVLKRCNKQVPDAYQRNRCPFHGSRILVDAAYIASNSVTEVYIEGSRTGMQSVDELVFKPDKNFYGFWIVFPRGLRSHRMLTHTWGNWEYTRSWPDMGIFGFNIDSSRHVYRETLFFYKDDIQTHSLALCVVSEPGGGITWSYEATVCQTSCATHGSTEPIDLIVNREDDERGSQMGSQIEVSLGVRNLSWVSKDKCEVQMTYITFNGDDEVL